MAKIWKVDNDDKLDKASAGKYHPIILKLLKNRGIEKPEEISRFFQLDYEKSISDSCSFSGMEKAVERVNEAVQKNQKVAIFGDYDADGVTSTVLLHEALIELGIKQIVCYIPDRQLEGYGMNPKAVKYLKDQEVDLIITVDCGITNVTEVEDAKKLGMDVIITDHHHIPQLLPDALSIINPNMKNSGFDSCDFAGVGVAFKLAQALYKKIKPEAAEQLKWALDLVAIGTIADCMPLIGENRTLTRYGLIVLSKTRRAGLQEMFKVGRIVLDENNPPDTHKVAFQIAPRINAAGRMDHANISYALIMEKDRVRAREMALDVEKKNQERQKVTAEIFREVQIIAQNSYKDKKFIFAASPHWPVGILGLVAGKIADQFKKPTVICQKQESDHVGSLRSVPEVDIIEVLSECGDQLKKFGGHSQAAGIKVDNVRMEEFYQKFEKCVEEKMSKVESVDFLDIDMEISAKDVDWDLMHNIRQMEPFGMGNPEPVFQMNDMAIVDVRTVGNGNGHLKMGLRSTDKSPKVFEAIGFGFNKKFPDLKKDDNIDIVFNLQEDSWNGNKKMQLNLIDLKINT